MNQGPNTYSGNNPSLQPGGPGSPYAAGNMSAYPGGSAPVPAMPGTNPNASAGYGATTYPGQNPMTGTPGVQTAQSNDPQSGGKIKIMVITHILAILLGLGGGYLIGQQFRGSSAKTVNAQSTSGQNGTQEMDASFGENDGGEAGGKQTNYAGVMKEILKTKKYQLVVSDKGLTSCIHKSSYSTSGCSDKPDGIYLFVKVKMKNISSEDIFVSKNAFKMARNGQMVSATEMTSGNPNDEEDNDFDSTLKPTIERDFTIYFDINESDAKQKGWKLTIPKDQLDNRKDLVVDLEKMKAEKK